MIRVRLAYETDLDALIEMAHENVTSTRPDMDWNEDKFIQTFYEYLDTASPTFFVADKDGEAIGFLLADVFEYRAANGLFTVQEVLYVRPANRGSRAATLLMKELIAWSEMLGAKEIIGGNDNDFQSERTARFLEHFGFKRVGYSMRRVGPHGRQEPRQEDGRGNAAPGGGAPA